MRCRRVTIVTSDLLGFGMSGGAGAMAANLALALGLAGHEITILHTGAPRTGDPPWLKACAHAKVTITGVRAATDVVPEYLAPSYAVLAALRADPPEILVADDWLGRAFLPLRLRETGRGLTETAVVLRCAGPAGWMGETAGKIPVNSPDGFATDLTERASVGLADVVVSPSAFLLEWMRARGWPVQGNARVIPNLVHSAAAGVTPPSPAPTGGSVTRLTFFGRLSEGKGVRVLVDAINGLDPSLLSGRELVFVGGPTARWNERSIRAALDRDVQQVLSGVRFESTLAQPEALAELRRPGTLAVMPYLLDNWPHAVAECIEQQIPFLASNTGGTPEIVAESDRARVLIEPTPDGIRAALSRVLAAAEGPKPARFAHDPRVDVDTWLELVDTLTPPARRPPSAPERVTVIAVDRPPDTPHVQAAAGSNEVLRATSRSEGLRRASSDWVIFLDRGVALDDQALEALLQAQAHSDADVVTCGIRGLDESGLRVTRLFVGSPGALGLVENCFGKTALIRRSLLDPAKMPTGPSLDPDWPLLASLDLGGCRIVSIPEPLVECDTVRVGTVRDVPGEGLAVLRLYEAADAPALADGPRLIAALAHAQPGARAPAPPRGGPAPLERLVRRVRRLAARR